MRRTFLKIYTVVIFSALCESAAFGQLLESPFTIGAGSGANHGFALNPAVFPPAAGTGAGSVQTDFGARRSFDESTISSGGDTREVQTSRTKIEAYGVAAQTDLGAGATAGLTIQREYTDAISENLTSGSRPQDLMHKDYLGAKLVIDLTTEVKVGLLLRLQTVSATVVGAFTSQRNSFTYNGSLLGYGAGVNFSSGLLSVGAAYLPILRGKAEIMGEEKIVTEPGYALGEFSYGKEPWNVSAQYQRCIHKRDDRAQPTTNAADQGVSVMGVDIDHNLLCDFSYGLSVRSSINPQLYWQAGLMQENGQFIFNPDDIPEEEGSAPKVQNYRLRAAVGYQISPRLHFEIGGGLMNRNVDFSVGRFRLGTYKGQSREMLGVLGTAW